MLMKSLLFFGLLCGGALAVIKRLDPESGKCGCCPKCCSCVCTEKPEPVCEKELELCILQDSSGSISPADWIVGKTFLADLIMQFNNVNNKVAHISYSSNATLNWALNSETGMNIEQTKAALLALAQFQGAFTNPVEALQLMLAAVFNGEDNQNVPNVCLMVTDGRANFQLALLEAIAQTVHETVTVVVIGVTTEVNKTELGIMASGPGGSNVFTVDDFNDLVNIINGLIVPLCLDDASTSSGADDCFCCCPPPKPFYNPYGFAPPMMGGYHGGHGCNKCPDNDW